MFWIFIYYLYYNLSMKFCIVDIKIINWKAFQSALTIAILLKCVIHLSRQALLGLRASSCALRRHKLMKLTSMTISNAFFMLFIITQTTLGRGWDIVPKLYTVYANSIRSLRWWLLKYTQCGSCKLNNTCDLWFIFPLLIISLFLTIE